MKSPALRNIFNCDGETWMTRYPKQSSMHRKPGAPLTAAEIHRYVGVLAESGVDTLCIHAADRIAYYPTKNVPSLLDHYKRGDRSFFYGAVLGWEMTASAIENYLQESVHRLDGYLDLAEAGVNWLAETAAACRKHGITPWANVRMNDMHGNPKYQAGYYSHPPLFLDPSTRLCGVSHNPTAPMSEAWRGWNYADKRVRDYVFALLRDVVENHDFEGLELDWSRWPLCCEPDAPAGTTELVTEWHAEVRRMTERRAVKIGKPYTLGVKWFGTLDQMKSIGLDFRAMAKQKLIDFASPTNAWQTSWDIPCDDIAKELPGVAIHGVVEFCPNFLHGFLPNQPRPNTSLGNPLAVDYRLSPACPPILRGNAAAKLVLGVKALEVYNFACSEQTGHWPWPEDETYRAHYEALRGLSDIEALRGQPKMYTFSSQSGYYSHQLFESVAPFPLTLGPGDRRAVRLPMLAESTNTKLEFVIQVVVKKKDKLPALGVYINGCYPNFSSTADDRLLFPVATMTHHMPTNVGLNFRFPLASIKEGWNEIVVIHGTTKDFFADQAGEMVHVEAVECAVR